MAGGLGGLGKEMEAEIEWGKVDGGAGAGGASVPADQYQGGLLAESKSEEEEGLRGGEEAKRRLLQEEQRSAKKKRLEDKDSLSIFLLAHRSCVPLCGHFGLIV